MKQHRNTYRKALSTILLLTITALAHFASALAAPAIPDPNTTPKGELFKVKIFTSILRPLKPQDYERELDIYLPAAYLNDNSETKRFPVLYLLHGSPGYPDDFAKNGHWPAFLEQTALADGFVPPILVAPNGNYTEAAFGDSEWLNSADGNNRFEDFIVKQVVPWIDQHYRTIATQQARAIGGVSEGGYGAVNIALHNPLVFGNIIALSGYYNNDGSGWARKSMGHNKEFLANNSPLTFINDPDAAANLLTEWQTQHYFIGSGLDEHRYTTESAEMVTELQAHKVQAVLCQIDGKHSWALWNALYIDGLNALFAPSTTSTSPPLQSSDQTGLQ